MDQLSDIQWNEAARQVLEEYGQVLQALAEAVADLGRWRRALEAQLSDYEREQIARRMEDTTDEMA